MINNIFLNSSDIYLEKDGKRVADVQSYESRNINEVYHIKLTRVYLIDVTKDLHELESFNLIVQKRTGTIQYIDCKVQQSENEYVCSRAVYDKLYIVAKERREV